MFRHDKSDLRASARPPYFGPRMKWTILVVVLVCVVSYLVQHWWTAWVKQGLGW
ncbi:MAG TPA: hypothetical protein VLI90_06875 [Tepidisphaeraceae bacterium]|nr:hypothetical protein [Tepidisphaeraceae bacterium]